EARLREAPDDLASWSAYADWLTEQGAPRGELMAVQTALEDDGRSAKDRVPLKEREVALLADRTRWLAEGVVAAFDALPDYHKGLTFEFRRGWLQAVNLALYDRANYDLLVALSADPAARWVRSFQVAAATDGSNISVLARAPFLPFLRRLHIGDQEEN